MRPRGCRRRCPALHEGCLPPGHTCGEGVSVFVQDRAEPTRLHRWWVRVSHPHTSVPGFLLSLTELILSGCCPFSFFMISLSVYLFQWTDLRFCCCPSCFSVLCLISVLALISFHLFSLNFIWCFCFSGFWVGSSLDFQPLFFFRWTYRAIHFFWCECSSGCIL